MMEVRQCPSCGLRNSNNAWSCLFCGNTLSITSVVAVNDVDGRVIHLIGEINQEEILENKQKLLDELSKHGVEPVEIPNFLKRISETDPIPEVRAFAKDRLNQIEIGEGEIGDPIESREDSVKLQTEIEDENGKLAIIKSAFHFSAFILIIDAIYMILVHILTQGFEFHGFLAPVASGILAYFLFEYKNWARILAVAKAIISVLSVIFYAFSQASVMDAVFLVGASIGLPISLGILLIGDITDTRVRIGKTFFYVFSLVPMLCVISMLIASGFLET